MLLVVCPGSFMTLAVATIAGYGTTQTLTGILQSATCGISPDHSPSPSLPPSPREQV